MRGADLPEGQGGLGKQRETEGAGLQPGRAVRADMQGDQGTGSLWASQG